MAARKRVAVLGVGTMGSQAAWRLASWGADDVLTRREVAARYPQVRLQDSDVALRDRTAGYLRPELPVHTASQRAEHGPRDDMKHIPATGIGVPRGETP